MSWLVGRSPFRERGDTRASLAQQTPISSGSSTGRIALAPRGGSGETGLGKRLFPGAGAEPAALRPVPELAEPHGFAERSSSSSLPQEGVSLLIAGSRDRSWQRWGVRTPW